MKKYVFKNAAPQKYNSMRSPWGDPDASTRVSFVCDLRGLLTGKIQSVWASEIEPFAVMVTRRRMPRLRRCGDITKLNGGTLEPVDIITGGRPCQDLPF